MSNLARYNAADGRAQVKFASGGGPGGPNTYDCPGVGQIVWAPIITGKLGAEGDATYNGVGGRYTPSLWLGYKI